MNQKPMNEQTEDSLLTDVLRGDTTQLDALFDQMSKRFDAERAAKAGARRAAMPGALTHHDVHWSMSLGDSTNPLDAFNYNLSIASGDGSQITTHSVRDWVNLAEIGMRRSRVLRKYNASAKGTARDDRKKQSRKQRTKNRQKERSEQEPKSALDLRLEKLRSEKVPA